MPERGCDMISLALPPEDPQQQAYEPRYAVHRRLHDRSQDQSLLRLRPDLAGDRTLGADDSRRAARADGRAAGADGCGRAAVDVGTRPARVIRLSAGAGGLS